MLRFIIVCIEIFFFFIFTSPVFLYMKLISKKNPDKAEHYKHHLLKYKY